MIALFSLSLIALVVILALSINDAFTSEAGNGCADGLATAPLARGKFYVMPKYHPQSKPVVFANEYTELSEEEFAQLRTDLQPYTDRYEWD